MIKQRDRGALVEYRKKYRQKRSENTEKYRKNTEKRDEIQNFLRPEKFASEADLKIFKNSCFETTRMTYRGHILAIFRS